MENTMKPNRMWKGAFAVVGATIAACAACCISIPLVVSLLAWAGISGVGALATGWYLGAAGVFVAGLLGYYLVRRHRKGRARREAASCGCESTCRT